MIKELIKTKLCERLVPLDKDDLTVDEKITLYETFAQLGMSESTAYLRLFSKGFVLWEVLGIQEVKRRFLSIPEINGLIADPALVEECINNPEPGYLYNVLKRCNKGLISRLCEYMRSLGMISSVTVHSRFSTDKWKPYETVGVQSVITEWMRNQ